MIGYLRGQLFSKTPEWVIIDVGGIGYEVYIPLSTFYALPEKDTHISLYIHTHLREDAITLFGFHTQLEKKMFILLISVSGIGPKLGVSILSGIDPDELLAAISSGNTIRLQSIPGVGKKTSERIVLELKDKATKLLGTESIPSRAPELESPDKNISDDALSALINLGYAARSARSALEKAMQSIGEITLEGLIREALKILS